MTGTDDDTREELTEGVPRRPNPGNPFNASNLQKLWIVMTGRDKIVAIGATVIAVSGLVFMLVRDATFAAPAWVLLVEVAVHGYILSQLNGRIPDETARVTVRRAIVHQTVIILVGAIAFIGLEYAWRIATSHR